MGSGVPAFPRAFSGCWPCSWVAGSGRGVLHRLSSAGQAPIDAGNRNHRPEQRFSLSIGSPKFQMFASNKSELVLPGNIEPVTEAPVLARATGYVKARYVDIGDRVTQGTAIGRTGSARRTDHQVAQARSAIEQAGSALEQASANLQQARANEKLLRNHVRTIPQSGRPGCRFARQERTTSRRSMKRSSPAWWRWTKPSMSPKETKVHRGHPESGAAYRSVQAYQKVKAPFAGVITTRNVDVGALVNEGSTLLYRIAQTDRLRTYINVPQRRTRMRSTPVCTPVSRCPICPPASLPERSRARQTHSIRRAALCWRRYRSITRAGC